MRFEICIPPDTLAMNAPQLVSYISFMWAGLPLEGQYEKYKKERLGVPDIDIAEYEILQARVCHKSWRKYVSIEFTPTHKRSDGSSDERYMVIWKSEIEGIAEVVSNKRRVRHFMRLSDLQADEKEESNG